MDFSELIDLVEVSLKTPISGLEKDEIILHFEKMRGQPSEQNIPRKSGVLVFFYPVEDVPHMLFIKRSTYKGAHSGQISFPGGKKEKKDFDIIATALREAHEEVAISQANILGKLSQVYVPVSNFIIHPIIGYLDERPEFQEEAREVEAIIEFPVENLLKDDFFMFDKIDVVKGLKLPTYYFLANGHVVWGATAMIVAELRRMLLALTKHR